MLCVVCGEKATVEAFCDDCFLKDKELFKIKNITIKTCIDCGSFFDTVGTYVTTKDMIDAKIKNIGEIKSMSLKERTIGNKINLKITCEGIIKPAKKLKVQEIEIQIIIKKHKCDTCTKLAGNYHEAVMQIRNESAMKAIKKFDLSNTIIATAKNGYNIKFIDKKNAIRIATYLSRRYKIIRSYKFVTEKKGKKLYRDYFSVK